MKLNILFASALLLGTTALAVPSLAADNGATPTMNNQASNGASSTPATPASATDQNQTAMANGSQPASSTDTSMSNTQVAMNTTGTASDLSSVADNQHKYSKAKKSSEDRSEDQTTKQLNQQESSLNGGSGNTQ